MVYADAEDLIARYDEQTVKDLLSDTGEPIADLGGDERLSALLESASGRVEAALLVAKHYNANDLEGLTGNSLALLKDIVCDLTMARLLRRRPEKFGGEAIANVAKEAEDYLDRLRNGDRIFDVPARQEAGLPSIDGPTALDYERLNLIPDRTKNFYPVRGRRLPIGR